MWIFQIDQFVLIYVHQPVGVLHADAKSIISLIGELHKHFCHFPSGYIFFYQMIAAKFVGLESFMQKMVLVQHVLTALDKIIKALIWAFSLVRSADGSIVITISIVLCYGRIPGSCKPFSQEHEKKRVWKEDASSFNEKTAKSFDRLEAIFEKLTCRPYRSS